MMSSRKSVLDGEWLCNIVPLVSSQLPIEIQLKCRFFKFYKSLLQSDNELIRYLSKIRTFSSNCTMGKNLNQILDELDLDMFELDMLSPNKLKNMYYDKWITSVNNLYLIHSKFIYDLCMMKERVFFSNQYRHECEFFIRFFVLYEKIYVM